MLGDVSTNLFVPCVIVLYSHKYDMRINVDLDPGAFGLPPYSMLPLVLTDGKSRICPCTYREEIHSSVHGSLLPNLIFQGCCVSLDYFSSVGVTSVHLKNNEKQIFDQNSVV